MSANDLEPVGNEVALRFTAVPLEDSEATAYESFFFFSSRRRHTRFKCDWSSDVCSSDLSISAMPARNGTGDPEPLSAAAHPGAAHRQRRLFAGSSHERHCCAKHRCRRLHSIREVESSRSRASRTTRRQFASPLTRNATVNTNVAATSVGPTQLELQPQHVIAAN